MNPLFLSQRDDIIKLRTYLFCESVDAQNHNDWDDNKMYIGGFCPDPLFQPPHANQRRSALPQFSAGSKSQSPQRDRVDLGNHSQKISRAGFYHPSQMQPIPTPVISESASKKPPNNDFVDLSTLADLNGDFSYINGQDAQLGKAFAKLVLSAEKSWTVLT